MNGLSCTRWRESRWQRSARVVTLFATHAAMFVAGMAAMLLVAHVAVAGAGL